MSVLDDTLVTGSSNHGLRVYNMYKNQILGKYASLLKKTEKQVN